MDRLQRLDASALYTTRSGSLRELVRAACESSPDLLMHIIEAEPTQSERLIQRLRSMRPRTLIVVITPSRGPDLERVVRQAGAHALIAWPDDAATLTTLLRSFPRPRTAPRTTRRPAAAAESASTPLSSQRSTRSKPPIARTALLLSPWTN